MISIDGLHISYDGEQNVINGLNLNLQTAMIHGIVGLNGSGKTTLLNSLFGFVRPNSGSITFNSETLTKKSIAYLKTENYFYPNITGNEYLSLFINPAFNTTEWNELFQLPLDHLIEEYSTGMRKKLALLGILKTNRPILILDEPFNGLDIESSRMVRSVLLKLKANGKTIIVTSHILETLTNMCNQIHLLEDGRITASRHEHEFEEFSSHVFNKIEAKNKALIDKLIP